MKNYCRLLEIMRGSKALKNLYSQCINNNLYNYYSSLEEFQKEIFYDILEILNCINKKLLNDKEKTIIKKYNEMINELSKKCEDNNISSNEMINYVTLLAYSIIGNYLKDEKLVTRYLNDCYFNGKRANITSEHILLLIYMKTYLNQMFNLNVNLFFDEEEQDFARLDLETDELWFNINYYKDLIKSMTISKEDNNNLMFFEALSILHEFFHDKQINRVLDSTEPNKLYDERIRKELKILQNDPDFYYKYHDNFKIEQDANKYGIEYAGYLIKNIISKKDILKSQKAYIKLLKKVYKKIIDPKEFDELLEEEYNFIDKEKVNVKTYK